MHNNKYTSEYHVHLTTAQCSLITEVHRTRTHIQCQTPSTAGRALGMRTWRELGLVASLTRADVGGIIIQYTIMVPVTAGGPLPVLLRLTTGDRVTRC